MHEYVDVAAHAQEAKRRRIPPSILSDQLSTAERSLHDAENALEAVQGDTITLPGENTPIAPGVQATTDPALTNYFTQKFEYDDLKHDREALEKILANPSDSVSVEAALLIPSVSTDPERSGAARRLHQPEQGSRRPRDGAAGVHGRVPDHPRLQSNIDQLQTQTIPRLAQNLLTQLKERESTIRAADLGESRTIFRRFRLARSRKCACDGRSTCKRRCTGRSRRRTPKPSSPKPAPRRTSRSSTRRSRRCLPSTEHCVARHGDRRAARTRRRDRLAILLDTIDGRIRYPEQVTNEFGLPIAAAIPKFPRGTVNTRSPEQIAHARRGVPIAANARTPRGIDAHHGRHVESTARRREVVCLGEPGYVVRRRRLSDRCSSTATPGEAWPTRSLAFSMEDGLTDYLAGEVDLTQIIRQTSH